MATDHVQSFYPTSHWGEVADSRPLLRLPRSAALRLFAAALATAGLFAAGIAAGVLWSHVSHWPEETFLDLKANLREATGMSKHWHVLPVVHGTHTQVACPDPASALVIVTGGQSNSANANSAESTTKPGDNAYDWYNGACYISADPVPGATGTKGSLWPLLGADVAAGLGRPVVMIHGGIGGSQVADWLDPRSGYYAALSNQIGAAQAAGYTPDIILWHQGETDAARHPDPAVLAGTFGALMDRLLADMPGAQVYLFKASKCVGRQRDGGVGAVRDAQSAAAATRDRVVAGLDTDTLGNDFRWDTCHFNSLGRDAIRAAVVPQIVAMARGGVQASARSDHDSFAAVAERAAPSRLQ